MSKNYDNWERLVAAVIKKQQIWELCHQPSRTPSLRSSISSDFSSSFSSTTASFNPANPVDRLFNSVLPLKFQTVAGLNTRLNMVTKEKLQLFEDSPLAFGLQELLMAPCFILGEEVKSFSSAYVVSFKEDVNAVVRHVRRSSLLDQRWKIIQSLKHENVVRMRGFFISGQGGTFGICDYFRQGSLHTMLHGIKGENEMDLDWEARIRIAIGAANGLVHIHRQGGNFVHGSVKASNVFLNSHQYGCLDVKPDYDISLENRMCHALEVRSKQVASQAGDVYSFGVLLIELVSGRSPLHYTKWHESFADWMLHNARDELTTMVFDTEVVKYSLAKQAMWDLLGVASLCVREKADERPKMNSVAEMLENKFCYT
ncbi:hypothetical protein ACS0TY_004667 [Phlomoides rotata]